MKKIFALALSAVMTFSLAACGTPAPSSQAISPAAGAAALTGKITTGGSTSMEKIMGALQEVFMAENNGVDITYSGTGSGAGIQGANEGTLDIGLSSRALKSVETGLTATTVALDGIAVIVNKTNTVQDLTLEQIKGLATGEITNWSEVGGPDRPVVLIGREAGSGTRDGFESIVGVADICKYDQELTATGAVIAAVAANENAFGYASISSVDGAVTAVTVEGVAPSEETVLNGTYQIQRPFVFVTKEGAELLPAVEAFMTFATSKQAAELIANAGAVPVAQE